MPFLPAARYGISIQVIRQYHFQLRKHARYLHVRNSKSLAISLSQTTPEADCLSTARTAEARLRLGYHPRRKKKYHGTTAWKLDYDPDAANRRHERRIEKVNAIPPQEPARKQIARVPHCLEVASESITQLNVDHNKRAGKLALRPDIFLKRHECVPCPSKAYLANGHAFQAAINNSAAG